MELDGRGGGENLERHGGGKTIPEYIVRQKLFFSRVVLAHVFDPSTREIVAGGSLCV